MGQFLQSPDPAKKLARQYGIRGLFSPDLVPSIQPVVLIDDLSGGISNEPQRICVSRVTQAAVAAERFTARFETPTNTIAEILAIAISGSTASMQCFFGSSLAVPANTAAKAYTDGRLRSVGSSPAAVLTFGTGVPALAVIHWSSKISNTVNDNQWYNPGWIIGRTDAFDFLEFQVNAVNVAIDFNLIWREFDAVRVR